MRRTLIASSLALPVVAGLALSSCGVSLGQLCDKEFDCRNEIADATSRDLEDDYAEGCSTAQEGRQAPLRKNAEKECSDLADTESVLAGCLLLLDCEQLADFESNPSSEHCADQRQRRDDAAEKAATEASGCDGEDIVVAGEGEGEGEGEGGP